MQFLITKNKLIVNIEEWHFHKTVNNEYSIFIGERYSDFLKLQDDTEIWAIGDCINFDLLKASNRFSPLLIKSLKGIFYLIVIDNHGFQIYSSHFGLLPVYYSENYLTISNSLELIRKTEPLSSAVNKQFILESYLFNYPFKNLTYLNGVLRMDAFKGIVYKQGEIQLVDTDEIESWFPVYPESGRDNLKNLADIFHQQVKHYFSPGNNSITFTSGFDGRAIVSSALKHQVDFHSFSMGRPENDDVYNPMANAASLNIPYYYYDLGGEDYSKYYLELANRISNITGGFNGFLYPHFLYGTLKESANSDVLLTGYCGSELFRALHIQGAVTSAELVAIFVENDDQKLHDKLWNSRKLSFIHKNDFRHDFEALFEEIIDFRKQKSLFKNTNHFFYFYIFKEVFRKVFGSWTVAQFSEMSVRVPFLDYELIRAIIKTDLAGCNNDFFTHNPFKRIKGQLLYAEIIRQGSPQLFELFTGKGYRPSDLMTFAGNMRISLPYFKKKFDKRTKLKSLDNLGLVSNYLFNKEFLKSEVDKLSFVDKGSYLKATASLHEYTPETIRDLIFQTASLTFINKL